LASSSYFVKEKKRIGELSGQPEPSLASQKLAAGQLFRLDSVHYFHGPSSTRAEPLKARAEPLKARAEPKTRPERPALIMMQKLG
jgi:hypothetical protein